MSSARGGKGGGGMRRGNMNPWGRLKPVHQPALEQYGLPSKGDKRLLDRTLQETYYARIVESYMKFCASSTSGDDLAQQFASMTMTADQSIAKQESQIQGNKTSAAATAAGGTPPAAAAAAAAATSAAGAASTAATQLSAIFSAIRSLREGIVASGRKDTFAQQVYMFTIRAAILTRHMESYHPALLHLLKVLHKAQPLSKTDLSEFAAYLVLDMTCRQRDYAAAYATRSLYNLQDDLRLGDVLGAVVHDNYYLFWKSLRGVDKYRAKLMESAEEEMRGRALKCLSRTYFSVDIEFLKRATQADWEELRSTFNVGWELSGTTVIIRKPKGR